MACCSVTLSSVTGDAEETLWQTSHPSLHQCCISDYGPMSFQFSLMLVSGVECWHFHCCGSDGCSPCGGCTCGPGAHTRNRMISTAFPVVYLHSQLEKEMCCCSNVEQKLLKQCRVDQDPSWAAGASVPCSLWGGSSLLRCPSKPSSERRNGSGDMSKFLGNFVWEHAKVYLKPQELLFPGEKFFFWPEGRGKSSLLMIPFSWWSTWLLESSATKQL